MNCLASNGSTAGAYLRFRNHKRQQPEATMHLLDLADTAILFTCLAFAAAIVSASAYRITH